MLLLLLAIIPAITVIMIFTNEYHGLMRYNVALDTSGSFSVITKTYGIWFWISVIYHDIIMVTGVVMTFGVARYHLLSVIPIAREFVLEKIVGAILVVDGLNRVEDYNESCREPANL